MELKSKPHILVLIDWYLPGYKAGGPIQSISNFVRAMQADYRFSIITMNVDHVSDTPYPDVPPDQWLERPEGASVYYFSREKLNQQRLFELIDESQPDFLYVNSMYSVPFTMWPLRYLSKHHPHPQLVLAPRGMLQAGAVKQKRLKKLVYLNLMRLTGIQHKVIWQATDQQESEDIRAFFGKKQLVRIASNFPKQDQDEWTSVEKKPGEAKLVFHSRVSPKKNLEFMLEKMKGKKGLSLDVFGPLEEPAYVEKCKSMVAEWGLQVRFMGGLPPTELKEQLKNYHFSILTTLGENFGHSIFEGMLAGKPVLISDRTPWRGLESLKAGWDIPLTHDHKWEEVITFMLDMDQETYDNWSQSAWKQAELYKNQPELKENMRSVFL